MKVEMNCSQLTEPAITVTIQPDLQPELVSREAVNKKVAVGYQCSGGIESNVTTTVSFFRANKYIAVVQSIRVHVLPTFLAD